LINAYDVEIEPGEQRTIVADDIPAETQILEAQLGAQDGESGDDLALDDRAWAVHRQQQPVEVLLVSEGNLFLETALALFPHLQVSVIKPEDFGPSSSVPQDTTADDPGGPADPGEPDAQSASGLTGIDRLTILDGIAPITATLPPGNLLFIAPLRSSAYFSVTGKIDHPMPRPVDINDPLLAHVSLTEVGILEAVRIPLPGWARPVIAGDNPTVSPLEKEPGEAVAAGSTPLLFAGETDGRRIAVLCFALHRSDLPLQVAFPLLIANLTGWLAPGAGSNVPAQVAPGDPLALPMPPEVETVRVTRPDGSVVRLEVENGQAIFADTAQLGVYRAQWDQGEIGPSQADFAVNLFSPQESRIQPASSLPITSISPQGQATEKTSTAGSGQDNHRARREWWRPLAFVALGLLVAEWLVYQRATVARLMSRITAKRQA